jgi:hypothetical protein
MRRWLRRLWTRWVAAYNLTHVPDLWPASPEPTVQIEQIRAPIQATTTLSSVSRRRHRYSHF